MNDEYEKLLEEAKKKLPNIEKIGSRFEVPKPAIQQTGRQTIIKNFIIIAKSLRREPEHLSKFLFKELAVPGSIKGDELMLVGKLKEDIIKRRIDDYMKEYVICNECGKPDTKIGRKEKIMFIKCEACGASRSIKRV